MSTTVFKKGFTLIELLVVISILSVLSSVVIATLQSSKVKAQKAVFAENLFQFQKALEVYKADTGYYPYENELAWYDTSQFYIDSGHNSPLTNSLSTIFINDPSDGVSSQVSFIPKYLKMIPPVYPDTTINGTYYYIYYVYKSGITDFWDGSDDFCGSRPIKDYVLFYHNDGGVNIDIPLPKLIWDGVENPGDYCLTGN